MQKTEFWNSDCIVGARKHLADNSVDLIITDPPYGIEGDKLDKHYNRDEENVIPGYVEVALENYSSFTLDWMTEAARVLRPGGTMYVVSGWSNLFSLLQAVEIINADSVRSTGKPVLETVNHIVWKYNFGVFTKRKFVTSHYHILMVRKVKPKGYKGRSDYVFNYMPDERSEEIAKRTLDAGFGADKMTKGAYRDMEDVWNIKRQYRPGEVKNKNMLPDELIRKMIAYSSNKGDVICDFFLGGFTTATNALDMGRRVCGFEMNKNAFKHFTKKVKKEYSL